MKVSLRVPSSSGTALKLGMLTMVKSGTWRRYSSAPFKGMNMLRAKRLCQAYSVMMRTGNR